MSVREHNAVKRLAIVVAVMLAAVVTAARAEQGPEIALSAGSYDMGDTNSIEAGAEFRLRPRAWGLMPTAGATFTTDGAFWAYGGFRRPFRIARGWQLTPGFAIALYEAGSEGKDLSGPIEFRSSLSVARRFASGSAVGLTFYHLSNASIFDSKDNPGSNSLILNWTIPVSRGR